MFRIRIGHYIEIPTSCIHRQIGAGICAVRTVETVATGKVNCYNYIFHLPMGIVAE